MEKERKKEREREGKTHSILCYIDTVPGQEEYEWWTELSEWKKLYLFCSSRELSCC